MAAVAGTKVDLQKRLKEIRYRWSKEFRDTNREEIKGNRFVRVPSRDLADDIDFLLRRIDGKPEPAAAATATAAAEDTEGEAAE